MLRWPAEADDAEMAVSTGCGWLLSGRKLNPNSTLARLQLVLRSQGYAGTDNCIPGRRAGNPGASSSKLHAL